MDIMAEEAVSPLTYGQYTSLLQRSSINSYRTTRLAQPMEYNIALSAKRGGHWELQMAQSNTALMWRKPGIISLIDDTEPNC